MEGGQKCNKRERSYGEGSTILLAFRNLCEGLLIDYLSVSALAWLFLHHVKSHTGSSWSPWFSPWDWPANMSAVKEMFWAIIKPGIPTVRKKITEGISRASLLCSLSRDLGLPACLCCSWLNQYWQHLDEPHPNTVGKWGIHVFCQCWSVLIFSYPGAE